MKRLLLFSALVSFCQGSLSRRNATPASASSPVELVRRVDDPTDFNWVNHLVAIGDSFTAGIGSGNQLGDFVYRHNDWACSRYDASYPVMVYDKLGSGVDKFQFHACSGDRSEQIFDQANDLDSNDVDMLIMTAGGNDLCLVRSGCTPSNVSNA